LKVFGFTKGRAFGELRRILIRSIRCFLRFS
jgi:hypothetical protein